MNIRKKPIGGFDTAKAFTLIETLVAFFVVLLVSAGIIASYIQANRMAKFSSLSFAAQSLAVSGAERMRAAAWDSQLSPYTNGFGTGDELVGTNSLNGSYTNYVLDATQPANLLWATNYLSVTTNQNSPQVRELRSMVVWKFPLTGRLQTNLIITLRSPDD